MSGKVSKYNALKHYTWGDGCDGWNLADEKAFSVKQESMPPGTAEAKHYHAVAQQFFFILKGIATFEIDGTLHTAAVHEGLHIKPGLKHQISNKGSEDLEFLLFSQPSTTNDRILCND
jgi:mannose-6-phosphate isomerase-like protein (cupin superfamily)